MKFKLSPPVPSHYVVLSVLIVSLLGGVSRADPLGTLYELLKSRSVDFDQGLADEAAVRAALCSIDPNASVVSGSNDTVEAGLTSEYWSQGIGYLDVPSLSCDIASNIVQQVMAWDSHVGVGVILDLRGAGGLEFDSVATVAGLVIDADTPLFEIISSDTNHVYKAQGSRCCRIPLVLLIDGETHDACEVLASVLKNRSGAMLVGAPSRGDATVRSPVRLTETLDVVVASGRIQLKSGADYHGGGVIPDVTLSASATMPRPIDVASEKSILGRPLSEKALQDRGLMKRTEGDVVLRRATDVLLGLKALGEFSNVRSQEDEDKAPEDK